MSSTTQPAPVAQQQQQSADVPSAIAVIWAIAVAKLVFHVYFNNRYGYFRDEFDYLSCGDHLQWGYVDQPPLIPFLIHFCRLLLGDSLRAIRFIPALASSLLVVQTAVLTRQLGGRRYAQILSAVCIVVAGMYLSNGSLLGTNSLEPNIWMGCAYCAIRAIKSGDLRNWLWFGIIAGIGLEEKYSLLVFALGIVVGLVLTAQRRVFLSQWIWLGGLAAFLIFLPNLLWNIHNGLPFLQLMRAIRAEGRDVVYGPVAFFIQQTMILNPATAPIWITGLSAFFTSPCLRPYRVLGWCYIVSYGVFFVLHGKNYYLAPIYPMLLAAGAVAIEARLERARNSSPARMWKPAIVVALLACGLYLLPLSVPVLAPEHLVTYLRHFPVKIPVNEHFHARAALPQWFADQFGYKEIADEATVAWQRIAAQDRADCAIFGQDYGQAGAVDFFGRSQGLPGALSGDRTYWLWGARGYSGNCMIVLDDRRDRLEQLFNHVEFVGTSRSNPWALEPPVDVYICRGAKFGTLAQVWPLFKRWR